METNNQVIEVEAEEIDVVEDKLKKEVGRFSLPDAKIAQMKEQYGGLVINGVEDKAGYNALNEALQIVKKTRTGIEAKRKVIKEDYLKIGTGIDGEAKRLTALLKPLEDELAAKKQAIDDEKEKAKKEKEAEAERKIQQRVTDLIAAGIVFDGTFYSIGDIAMDVVTLRNMPDDKYEVLKAKVGFEKKRLEEIELQKKQEEEKKQEEMRKQQEELKKQQDELKKQQEELQKQKEEYEKQQNELKQQQQKAEEEKKKLEEEKAENERKQAEQKLNDLVEGVNMLYTAAGFARRDKNTWVFKNDFEEIIATVDLQNPASYDDFKVKAEQFTAQIATARQKQDDHNKEQERQKKELEEENKRKEEEAKNRLNLRYTQLAALGMSYDPNHLCYRWNSIKVEDASQTVLLDDAAWGALLEDVAAKICVEKEEQEKLRQDGMNDKQKLEEYVAALKAVPGPGVFKTDEVSQKYGKFYDQFNLLTQNLLS